MKRFPTIYGCLMPLTILGPRLQLPEIFHRQSTNTQVVWLMIECMCMVVMISKELFTAHCMCWICKLWSGHCCNRQLKRVALVQDAVTR